jgi:hypothetical protein
MRSMSGSDQQYQNWRAKPLTSRLAVVDLIAATTTGLTVACERDTKTYKKGIKITKMATLRAYPSSPVHR